MLSETTPRFRWSTGKDAARNDRDRAAYHYRSRSAACQDSPERPMSAKDLKIIGWREWISLPDLRIDRIKAKIDTGARTSALHAFDIEPFAKNGTDWVRFRVHPQQRDTIETIAAEAQLLDRRQVRNSGGDAELRYVISTTVELPTQRWTVELTLTNRDAMGFRMLLGREAVRGRFWVDPGQSFLLGAAPPAPLESDTEQ